VFVSDVEPVGRALTSTDSWPRIGWAYEGDPEEGRSVFVADNANARFGPAPWQSTGFANEVSAADGVVTYDAAGSKRAQAIAAALAVIGLIGVAWYGRRGA
jgi:hypothetical protein